LCFRLCFGGDDICLNETERLTQTICNAHFALLSLTSCSENQNCDNENLRLTDSPPWESLTTVN
jgi:hypothetical protein